MPQHAPAAAFFLDGERFCLYHAPQGACRGGLVYIHPFAEEMNKSRRMAALQARALAALGYGVLQIDLHGCGDSGGEFADARWERWQDDVAAASAWLRERLQMPVGLWGLRLGALLALDCARTQPVAQLVLWQPVLQGAAFMTQFLRLRVAGAMLDGASEGTAELRARLLAGEAFEVAGYVLAPELVKAIDALDVIRFLPSCPVNWIEIVAAAERPITPAALRVAAEWTRLGAAPALHKVAATSFWSTQEITECPELIAATCSLLAHD
ncbi:hydrolase 2, exosortase A system-associated [Massilia sp. TSP1-1-2]|uniref:hydrolase 2, exosortase A system-associated n=1 Tax=unclassified Massilia TaxID=2609279 RepID=UPI003CFA2C28